MIAVGRENRQRARLQFGSPRLALVEQWAGEQFDEFDPEGIFDRNVYIHAFVTLHELLEDARVERLYVANYPDTAPAFAALAEREIAEYAGENPVGAYKYAITRPYLPASLRADLAQEYADFFDGDDPDGLADIFDAFIHLPEGDNAPIRKAAVHDLIFQDMPSVVGLTFSSGDDRQWQFSGFLDPSTPAGRDTLREFLVAALSRFEVEGTLDSGDVLIVAFDANASDLWLSPGLRLCCSSKPGKIWAQLNGFELTQAALARLSANDWEIIGGGGPGTFATKEWWTRQADEIALEALWILADVAESEDEVRIVGSAPAAEAWSQVLADYAEDLGAHD